jgi:2-aminoethylphosphonate-pyruvate transaminase
VVVPLQGSGTFSVEAAVATVVPRDGHVLVLDNGAYCKRAHRLSNLMGLPWRTSTPWSLLTSRAGVACGAGRQMLTRPIPSITHVVLIHCETGAGVLNPTAGRRRCLRAPRQAA